MDGLRFDYGNMMASRVAGGVSPALLTGALERSHHSAVRNPHDGDRSRRGGRQEHRARRPTAVVDSCWRWKT